MHFEVTMKKAHTRVFILCRWNDKQLKPNATFEYIVILECQFAVSSAFLWGREWMRQKFARVLAKYTLRYSLFIYSYGARNATM